MSIFERGRPTAANLIGITLAMALAGCAVAGPEPTTTTSSANTAVPDGGADGGDGGLDAGELAGHCDPYDGRYDYLCNNCHSYANREVDEQTGIIICGGTPDSCDPYENPGHHTFIYQRVCETEITECCDDAGGQCTRHEGETVCWVEYWNYGQSCRGGEVPEEGGLPPDISEDPDQDCVERFCGDQYGGDDERALPPGEPVEDPGPDICSSEDSCLDDTDPDACYDCCDWRANLWNHVDDPPTADERDDFICRCRAACDGEDPSVCDDPADAGTPDAGTDGGVDAGVP